MLKHTEAEKIMQPFLTTVSSRRQVLRYLQEGSNYKKKKKKNSKKYIFFRK